MPGIRRGRLLMVPVNLCRCIDPMYLARSGPHFELSLSMEMFSTMLSLIRSAGAVFALRQLGRSFSMMAETRRLVASGTYRFARHPISPTRSRSSECSDSLLFCGPPLCLSQTSPFNCGGCITRNWCWPPTSPNTPPTGENRACHPRHY
jgi:hypothetical protein